MTSFRPQNLMSTVTDFDYAYFDDPKALGYRGYDYPEAGHPVKLMWQFIVETCRSTQSQTAIDVGCAKGFLVEFLILQEIKAVGFDVSTYALSFTEALPCHHHDIRYGLPHSADAVIALGVLMYLEPEILLSVLSKIRRATRRVFLFSAHYRENRLRVPDPVRQITEWRTTWRETIESAGFRLTDQFGPLDVYLPR